MTYIPFTPKNAGGLCLLETAVQPADIIVCSGKSAISNVIKVGTLSFASHAALSIGNGELIEAIGTGVTRRRFNVALQDDPYAVVYRVKGISAYKASQVVKFALSHLNAKYDARGALGGGIHSGPVARAIFLSVFGIIPCAGADAGMLDSSDKFYCSELVLQAFKEAGMPILDVNPHTSVPGDFVKAQSSGKLVYVGHLRAGELVKAAGAR